MQKRLIEAQPADLSALYYELMKFKVELIKSLAAIILVLGHTLVNKLLFDMIGKYQLPHYPRKKPMEDADTEEG